MYFIRYSRVVEIDVQLLISFLKISHTQLDPQISQFSCKRGWCYQHFLNMYWYRCWATKNNDLLQDDSDLIERTQSSHLRQDPFFWHREYVKEKKVYYCRILNSFLLKYLKTKYTRGSRWFESFCLCWMSKMSRTG